MADKILESYQNTQYRYNNRSKQSIVLDIECGQTINFNENLIEPLIIDKVSDIYLDSITTYDCVKSVTSEANIGFLLTLDNFSIKSVSNNSSANRAFFIPNEQNIKASENASIGRTHKGKKLNYVTTIQPMKLSNISGKLTLLDGSASPFNSGDGRFILDLTIIPN